MPIAPIADAADESPIHAQLETGDRRAALSEALKRFGPDLGRFCMAMAGSQTAAADIVDACLLLFYEHAAELVGRPLRPWLFGKALRACRKRPPSPPPPAGARAVGSHAAETRAVLALLPRDQREVALLRYIGRLDYADIGALCDISPERARKQVGRALLNLRQETISDHPPAQEGSLA